MELIRRNARTLAVFFALSTAVLSALSRLGGLKSVKNTIWAEDAVIFFSQSIENGLHSLIIPYAGYLHTYNRIVAIISLLFPIGATPFIYFSGWLISSLVLIYAITRVSGSTILASSIAASVAFTLPSNGEIFYSLTNSQWLTGAALAILLTCPGKIARIKLDIPIIALASFSGPFAILITPIMILRIIALRDVRENAFAYSSISAGAITNLIILLCSSRISGQHASASLYDWERAIRIFLTFNYQSKILALASILFFITLAIKVVTEREKQARTQGLLLITSAILIYISSAAQFSPPTVITPTINGGLYFFIP
ncbi:MAG: hypothetical protein GAK36_00146 [Pseudomonas sp.]|nr:MAG: hypothetical protein GAK36_00146 [Pseudomonas sp.]